MTSFIRRNALAPLYDLQLQNGFTAIVAGEELGVPSNGASLGAVSEILGTTRRKQ